MIVLLVPSVMACTGVVGGPKVLVSWAVVAVESVRSATRTPKPNWLKLKPKARSPEGFENEPSSLFATSIGRPGVIWRRVGKKKPNCLAACSCGLMETR